MGVFLSPDTQGREISKSTFSKESKSLCPRFTEDIAGTKTSLMVCKAVVFILMQRADFRHFLHRQKTRGIYDKPTSHDQQMFLGHSAFLL